MAAAIAALHLNKCNGTTSSASLTAAAAAATANLNAAANGNAFAQQKQRLVSLKAQKDAPPPKPSCRQRLKFYVTAFFSLVLIAAGTAFLFVVPFFVDPALSTLMADFTPVPVACLTTKVEFISGISNCTWTSCREGCTADAYNCTHVVVRYTHKPFRQIFPTSNSTFQIPADTEPPPIFDNATEGALHVNVKGCGFPPEVDCARFRELYAIERVVFPCFYSRNNSTLVLPHYDRQEQIILLVYTLATPLGSSAISLTALIFMHGSIMRKCRKLRRKAKVHDQRPWGTRLEKLRKKQQALTEAEPT